MLKVAILRLDRVTCVFRFYKVDLMDKDKVYKTFRSYGLVLTWYQSRVQSIARNQVNVTINKRMVLSGPNSSRK